MEFFAFNQINMNYFNDYPIITYIWLWSFFGNLPTNINQTMNNLSINANNQTMNNLFINANNHLFLSYSYYSDHILILYIIGFVSACIVIPLFLLIKSLFIYKTKKIWNYNLIKIITQLCFLGFMPITTLCIKEFLFIETNTFELSLITICLFSFVTITFPAFIYKFIYGENKRKWRRKLYYLLDSFNISYKFFSIILMLKQILYSIILNIFVYNKILSNSLFMGFNIIFLFYNIIKKPFDKPYFHFQVIFNTSIELIILGINFIILNVKKKDILIYISLSIQVFFLLSNMIIIYKNKNYKNNLILPNSEAIELDNIYTDPIMNSNLNIPLIELTECNIPKWAKKEYIENKLNQSIFSINNNEQKSNTISSEHIIV